MKDSHVIPIPKDPTTGRFRPPGWRNIPTEVVKDEEGNIFLQQKQGKEFDVQREVNRQIQEKFDEEKQRESHIHLGGWFLFRFL